MKLDFEHERLLTPRKKPLCYVVLQQMYLTTILESREKLVDDLCSFYIAYLKCSLIIRKMKMYHKIY